MIRFSTRKFVASHGREPSRTVHALWLFGVVDVLGGNATFAASGTLAQAKKEARKAFSGFGDVVLEVMP